MNTIKHYQLASSLVLICIMLSGCTAKNLYQAAQENRRQNCIHEPPGQYEACLEEYSESYEEYEEKRQSLLKDATDEK